MISTKFSFLIFSLFFTLCPYILPAMERQEDKIFAAVEPVDDVSEATPVIWMPFSYPGSREINTSITLQLWSGVVHEGKNYAFLGYTQDESGQMRFFLSTQRQRENSLTFLVSANIVLDPHLHGCYFLLNRKTNKYLQIKGVPDFYERIGLDSTLFAVKRRRTSVPQSLNPSPHSIYLTIYENFYVIQIAGEEILEGVKRRFLGIDPNGVLTASATLGLSNNYLSFSYIDSQAAFIIKSTSHRVKQFYLAAIPCKEGEEMCVKTINWPQNFNFSRAPHEAFMLWNFNPLPDGTYQLVNKGTNRPLHLQSIGTTFQNQRQ